MANRPAGGVRSKRWDQAPYDWYQEPRCLADQMFENINFPNCTIYDPCCGQGTMLDAAKAAGYSTLGSDLIRRGARHPFAIGDILRVSSVPVAKGTRLGVACNPPYTYEDRICERIIRHVVGLPNLAKAVFVVPIAYMTAQERWSFFARETPLACVYICSERPTMPPGHMIKEMGDRAFKGAMQDYIWLEFIPTHKGPAQIKWLRPRGVA